MKKKFSFFHLINIFILIIIFLFNFSLYQNSLMAYPIIKDTNKITLKLEIKKLLDSTYKESEIQNLDSILNTTFNLDSICVMLEKLENLNFEDISTEIEVIKDSADTKELRIEIKGISPDSSQNEIKKIQIKINDKKQSSDTLKAQIEILKEEQKNNSKFKFDNMTVDEIREYIKNHYSERLNDEDIEIFLENDFLIIKVKTKTNKEN